MGGTLFNENLSYKHVPLYIAHSIEFRSLKVKNIQELQVLNKIKNDDDVKNSFILPKDNVKG